MLKHTAILFAAIAFAAPAHAQDATIEPDHIVALLKDSGHPAEYFNDDDDYRQILSKSGDYQFLVEMYDCVDGKACQTLEFYSNFPMEDPPTQELIEAYAGPRDGARIYLDRRGEASMQQELDVEGGLSDEEFLARLESWKAAMTGFSEYLSQPRGAPAVAGNAPAADAADAATEVAASTDAD